MLCKLIQELAFQGYEVSFSINYAFDGSLQITIRKDGYSCAQLDSALISEECLCEMIKMMLEEKFDVRMKKSTEYIDDQNNSEWSKPFHSDDDEGSMLSWAENEVRIACNRERGDKPDDEWDYGCACYESALKAYEAMMEGGHSGFSWGMTRQIFDRLAKGKPLTPIKDTDDVWNDISRFCGGNDSYKSYQCKRMSSLFKYVYDDGRVEYKDVDRFCCYNNSEDGAWYHSGLVDMVMYEKFPITMPYYPGDAIKVVCEDYLTDSKNGDFDTVGILYAIKPDGERVEINRYFKEGEDDFIEIAFCEYEMRRKMHRERLENLKKDCHGCFGAASDECSRCMEES